MLAVLVAFPAPTPLKVLSFNFSFSNHMGAVEGAIFGLRDNATGPARSVLITSYPAALAGGPFLHGPDPVLWNNLVFNSFTVSGGALTEYRFVSQHIVRRESDAFCLSSVSCAFGIAGGNLLTLNYDARAPVYSSVANADGMEGVAIAPVPLPAPAALLLLGALAGLALARLHRDPAAPAAAS